MYALLNEAELGKLLQQFANINRDVFWARSPDYQHQLYISPAFEEVWGRKCEDFYHHPDYWDEYLHPEDKKRLKENIAKRNSKVNPNDMFF